MKNKTNEILGGMFGWQEAKKKHNQKYPFLDKNNIFLINARSAIFSIIDTLKTKQIWLPDFLCETILDAVKKTKANIKFYNVNKQLEITNSTWITNVKKDDIVILIEYFGFPVNQTVIDKIKNQKALVLLDAAQSLLSENSKNNYDFIIYSPRKTIESPAGAIVKTDNKKYISNVALKQVPSENLFYIYNAFQKRTLFDAKLNIDWFYDYKKSEKNQAIGHFKIDDLSKSIIKHGVDYKFIKNRRRENFLFILKELSNISIFKELPKQTVPLGFPVLVKNRAEILDLLYKNNIFAPIHWPITKTNRPYNELLKNNEITLICDQRANMKGLEQMIKIIKSKI